MPTVLRTVFICIVCAALCHVPGPHGAGAADAGQPRLLKVVALSHHGVCAPAQSQKTLALWSTRAWPQWPVPEGFLTPRGARLVTAMWEDLRGKFLNLGLLPEAACPPPDSVFVRADTYQGARGTARALLDGLAPGCNLAYAFADLNPDPLFKPVRAGLHAFDPALVVKNILEMTGGDLEWLHEDNAGPLTRIDQLGGPPSPAFCARFNLPPHCGLLDIPNSVSVLAGGHGVELTGGLEAGAALAEIFLLEYGEWPESLAGWGQMGARTLREVLPLHTNILNVVNRAPMVARAKGSPLLSEMTAALTGSHYDQRCNTAPLVVFVGHDANIAHVSALLGIHWQIFGYPADSIPPGAALFLELWEQGNAREVRVSFFAHPLETLHAPLAELPPASQKPENARSQTGPMLTDPTRSHRPVAAKVTAPPVVGEARLSLHDFTERVQSALRDATLAPPQVPPLRLRDDPWSDAGNSTGNDKAR